MQISNNSKNSPQLPTCTVNLLTCEFMRKKESCSRRIHMANWPPGFNPVRPTVYTVYNMKININNSPCSLRAMNFCCHHRDRNRSYFIKNHLHFKYQRWPYVIVCEYTFTTSRRKITICMYYVLAKKLIHYLEYSFLSRGDWLWRGVCMYLCTLKV